jgi:hypothetical protein
MGRTASFFRTVGQPSGEIIGLTFLSGPGNVNTIAYTAQLGNGFLATIALEDPTTRRFGVASQSGVTAGGLIIVPNVIAGAGFGVAPGVIEAGPVVVAGNLNQIGNRMPNIVGSLRVDQAWGSGELSGMINEVGLNGNILSENGTRFTPSTKYGWAINGALKINLPMLAAGSNLTLNGVYSEGNLSAVLSNGLGSSFQGVNIGGIAVVTPDATVTQFGFGGGLRLTKAWGVTAGLQHFWTPTLSSTLFGSYAQVDVANQPLLFTDTLRDFNLWTLGVNTIWQPVRGLNIGLEAAYQRVEVQGSMIDVNKHTRNNPVGANTTFVLGNCNIATGANCRLKSSDGFFLTRLRVTRDF